MKNEVTMEERTEAMKEFVYEGDVKLEKKLITPELAKRMLQADYKHNRPLKSVNVNNLREEILTGNWEPYADIIKFTKSGCMFDGQNRLSAIILANQPAYCCCGFGYDERMKFIMNSGAPATATDIGISLLGEYNIHPYMYQIGQIVLNYFDKGNFNRGKYNRRRVINFILDPKYRHYFEEASIHAGTRKTPFVSTKTAMAIEILTRMIDNEKANDMFKRLYEGITVEGSFLQAFYNWLWKNKRNVTKKELWGGSGERKTASALFLAWERYMRNMTKPVEISVERCKKDEEGKLMKDDERHYIMEIIKREIYDPKYILKDIKADIKERFLKEI